TVSHVQSSDSKTGRSEILEFGSRSSISIPSVASQSACPRCEGNQNGALRSAVASVCGAIDWNDSSRVPGPNIILDGSRPGGEAPSLPALFQSTSHALGLGRTAARA